MSNFKDLYNRLGFIVLVYTPLLICLIIGGDAWKYFAIAVTVLVFGEVFYRCTSVPGDGSMWGPVVLAFFLMLAMAGGMAASVALRNDAMGFVRLGVPMVAVFAADSFAYGGGRAMKDEESEGPGGSRFKVIRILSPGKTDAGFVSGYTGGILATIIAASACAIFTDIPWAAWQVVLMAFILPAVAIASDLVESGTKRALRIKDFSRLLGDHGGFTDRFDAFSLTLLFYYMTQSALFT